MTKERFSNNVAQELRARAEKLLAAKGTDLGQMPREEVQKLVHELQVNQIELEMQNEDLHRIQSALVASQDRYAILYDSAPVPYFSLDPGGLIVEVNLTGTKLLGEPRLSLLQKPFVRFVAMEDHEEFRAHLRAVAGGRASQLCELLLIPKEGTGVPVALESVAITDHEGTVVQYLTVVRDLTPYRQMETALRQNEALYRLIVETATEGIWAMDAGYRITFVNPVMPKMLGYRMEEMLGWPVTDFIFPEDLDDHEEKMAQRRQGLDGTYERRFKRQDGSELWCIVSARSLLDDQGEFQGSFAMFTDITPRKQAEEAVKVAARQWQTTFDAMSDAICIMDLNCRILGCNQTMATLVGQPIDAILGCHCYEILHGTPQPIRECPIAVMRQSGQREEVVLPLQDRWVRVTVDPIVDDTGALLGAVHRIADITQLKKAKEALMESEAHFRQLFDSGVDAIFLHDHGKIVEANEQACRSLGYSREELLGLNIMDLEVEIDREKLLEAWKGKPAEDTFYGTHRRKDGSTFPVEIRSREFTTQGHTLRLGIVRDITAQRRAEQARRESEELFRSLFENMLNGFAFCKMLFEDNQPQDFIYLEVNRSFEVLTGLKNVVGKKASEVIPGFHESKPGLLEVYGRVALTGKPEHFESYVEGLKMWFSVSAYSPVKEYFVAVFDVITERKKAEEALRQSRETLRVLLDATPAAVVLLNPGGIILAGNKMLAERLGKPINAMVGTCIFDYFPGEVARARRDRLEEVKRTGRPLVFEDIRGGLIADNYIHPIFSGAGKLMALAVLSVDITARKHAEEALAQQSRFLQLLMDTIPTPVFYKDVKGRYLGCNQAFQEFFGLTKDDMIGKTVACLGPPNLVKKFRQMDLELFQNPGFQSYEYTATRKDGKQREVVINKATFLKADGTVDGLVGVFNDITELKEAQKELRALAARLAEVEEMQRHHLARELHDEVGQGLTALGLTLGIIKTQMPRNLASPLLTRLTDAVALVEKTGETIRNVMAELRPPVLDDYGLLSALRWYGAEFSRRTGIDVKVQGEEAAPRLGRPVELALFRIAQEALNNVAKHAGASEVVLREEAEPDTVRLVIVDNGIGFDQTRMGQPEGRYRWGLMNMKERAGAAGGSCRIESQSGQGTRVVVEVNR